MRIIFLFSLWCKKVGKRISEALNAATDSTR